MRRDSIASRGGLAALLGLLSALGCAGQTGGSSSGGEAIPETGAGGSGTGIGGGDTGGTVGGAVDGGISLPPEREVESSYRVPVATGTFVWITNPTSGRVAYVDAQSLAVRTVEAGNGPTYLAAIPGSDDAVIVLNVLSKDATILRASGGTLESQTVPGIAAGANSLAVSPDGAWAIAWTDARLVAGAHATQGFQEATIIDLERARTDAAGAHTQLAVGFRPVSFSFAQAPARAFAVTEDGVSVVSLDGASGPLVTANVALGGDATAAVDTRDVSVTADGRLAVVRREGNDTVSVVDLGGRGITDIPLSGPVTDVDVSADGTRAVAVVRDTAEVAVIPLSGAAPAAADVVHLTVAGEIVGQVTLTGDGDLAVLYSNAAASERMVVVSLGATPAYHVVRLHAPVLSVFPTADGKGAVVLHPSDAADGGATTAPAAGAFSLAPLDGVQPAFIQMTDAPIQAVALSPASDRALVTVRDDLRATYGVYLGRFPTLAVQRYPLASPPIAAGIVAGAGRGYVAQQQVEGRITFLTLDSGDARTLTGYELGARVVNWSTP